MFVPKKAAESPSNWHDYTLLVPTISVGNVGQLTTDLLISTLDLSCVGYLYTDCVVPVVGNNPYARHDRRDAFELTTAIEVFENTSRKLIVIQQRSPLLKDKRLKFVDEFTKWMESCRFKQIFILTSVFAHERIDSQLEGPQTRFLLTPKANVEIGSALRDTLKWIQLEKRPSELSLSAADAELFIPGSGISKPLFQRCSDAGLAAALVLIFCSEGDNVTESLQLASYINSFFQWLPLQEKHDGGNRINWKIPSSWQLQFGSHFNRILY